MKLLLVIIFTILSFTGIIAQIPNNGFENWSDGEPDDWLTNNLPGAWITVSSTGISHSGSFAARIEVADFNGGPIYPALAATFPISQNYGSLNGYYQFHPTINEMILIGLAFTFKDGQLIGTGVLEIGTTSTNYSQFSMEILGNGQTPDSIMIQFQILSDSPTDPGIASYAFIDQISFGQTTSVQQTDQIPIEYSLQQNYPNPFNPTTKIKYSVPVNGLVTLSVFNMLGEKIADIVNDIQQAGSYEIIFDASNLSSGMYIYQMKVNDFKSVKKMMIMK